MNCYLPWNLKDMTSISSEKLQKNIKQQTSYIDLYRTELMKESLRLNIASLLRHVCLNRESFGTDELSKKATDCLVVFLHAMVFLKSSYFAPTDVENPVVGKCAKNLHRLMLENIKATMRYIDYSVLLKVAQGVISEGDIDVERIRIHSEVFPDNEMVNVCSIEAINNAFFTLIDMETLKAHGFVDFDVQRNTQLDKDTCLKLSAAPRRDEGFEPSEYGIIGETKPYLSTPFIKYGNTFYSFVTAYALPEISKTICELFPEETVEQEPEQVEQPVAMITPEEEETPAEEPTTEPEPEQLEETEAEEEPVVEEDETPFDEPGVEAEPEPVEEPVAEEAEPEPEASEEPVFVQLPAEEETPTEEPEPEEEIDDTPEEEPITETEPEQLEETPFDEPEVTETTSEEDEIPFDEPVNEPVAEEAEPEPEVSEEPVFVQLPAEEEAPIEETESEPEQLEETEAEEEPVAEEDEIPFDEPEVTEATSEEEDDQQDDTEERKDFQPVLIPNSSFNPYDDDEDDFEEISQDEGIASNDDSAYTEVDEYAFPDEFEEDYSNSEEEAKAEEEEVYEVAEDQSDNETEKASLPDDPYYDEEPYTALVSPDTYAYLDEAKETEFSPDRISSEEEDPYDDEDDDDDIEESAEEQDEPDPYSGESLFSLADEEEEPVTPTEEPETTESIFSDSTEDDEPEPVSEPAPEPEPEPEPVPEPEPEPEPSTELPLLDQILQFSPSRNNPITQYLTGCTLQQKTDIVKTIEQARKKWIIDGKGKMFTIPETNISIAIFSESQDPMEAIQRAENIGAVMYASQKDSWNSLELSYDTSGQLAKADYKRISRSTFSDWEWKIVEKIGMRLIERRTK